MNIDQESPRDSRKYRAELRTEIRKGCRGFLFGQRNKQSSESAFGRAQPNSDFCGLSPTQMTNCLYAPFGELAEIAISTPNDLSTSPVMRYLALILMKPCRNWGYLDAWDEHLNVRAFWIFMLWRLQHHASIDQLIEEVCVAFPDFLNEFPSDKYFSPKE